MPAGALTTQVDPCLPRFFELKARQSEIVRTLGVAELRLAGVQYRLEQEFRLGGLTTRQREEVAGLEDMVLTARAAKAAIDGELAALVPPLAGQHGYAGDPVAIRITAVAGANVCGRFRRPGEIVVADGLTGDALVNGSLAAPVERL